MTLSIRHNNNNVNLTVVTPTVIYAECHNQAQYQANYSECEYAECQLC